MIKRLPKSGLAGHIVDGPRGPAGIAKAGVISLARMTEAAVVPFYTFADRAWYFQSWDRFMLPKPFSAVTIRFGQLIHFPATDDEQSVESQRNQLERTMQPELISL